MIGPKDYTVDPGAPPHSWVIIIVRDICVQRGHMSDIVEGEYEDTTESNSLVEQLGHILEAGEQEREGLYPWEQLNGEPHKWYQIFFRYYLMKGFTRSVVGAFRSWKREEAGDEAWEKVKERTGDAQHWYIMAARWDWDARARAYDEHRRLEDAVIWEARRRELREEEWGASSELLKAARETLKKFTSSGSGHPQDTSGRVQDIGKTRPGPRPVLRGSDISRFAEVGSRLGRLASGMATDQTISVSVQARLEEVKKERWNQVAPTLAKLLQDENDQDETVSEPPVAIGGNEDEADN